MARAQGEEPANFCHRLLYRPTAQFSAGSIRDVAPNCETNAVPASSRCAKPPLPQKWDWLLGSSKLSSIEGLGILCRGAFPASNTVATMADALDLLASGGKAKSTRTLLRVVILCFIAGAAIASRLFSVIRK